MRPRSLRMLVACRTPGTFTAASPAAAVKVDQPFCEVSTQSAAATCFRTALSIEPRSPLPSTATKDTSARPIISAAAVAAVRDGFRTAFWEASRPAEPPSRREGQPRTPASTVTSRDATPAVPTSSASAPNASASSDLPEPSRSPVVA